MITSIAFADIKGIITENNKLLVVTKKEGNFEAGDKIDFGMNAIFGTFEAVLTEEIKKSIKNHDHVRHKEEKSLEGDSNKNYFVF